MTKPFPDRPIVIHFSAPEDSGLHPINFESYLAADIEKALAGASVQGYTKACVCVGRKKFRLQRRVNGNLWLSEFFTRVARATFPRRTKIGEQDEY